MNANTLAILGLPKQTSPSASIVASSISTARLKALQQESLLKAMDIVQTIPSGKVFTFSSAAFAETCTRLDLENGNELLRRVNSLAKSPTAVHMLSVIPAALQEEFLKTYFQRFNVKRTDKDVQLA